MPVDDVDRLGKRILERLRVLEISQAEAARRAGVAPSWLSDLLKGRKKSVQSHNLTRMARALLTTPSYLMGESSDPTPREVQSADELAKLLPEFLSAPPIMRRLPPNTDFATESAGHRRPFRANTPKFTQSFISPAMLLTLRKHWDETLGPDPRARIPLFTEPVKGMPGAVQGGMGLPVPTLSLPVLEGSSGAYALAIPDDSMMPAVEPYSLVYAKPSILFFGGMVALRVVDPEAGPVFLVRTLLEKTDTSLCVSLLAQGQPELIPLDTVRSIHPVYAIGRDPALYGPEGQDQPEELDWENGDV